MNKAALIVGAAEAGKTTLARKLVSEHLGSHPQAIAFCHDPCEEYGPTFAKDAEEARRRILAAIKAGKELPRLMPVGGDSEALTRLALDIGERSNRAKDVSRPILVVYDEGSLLSGSGATYIGKKDQESLAIRRHRGVATIYLLQRPKQLPEPFWDLSTECYLFRGREATARKVEDLYQLEEGSLSAITRLQRFQFIHVRNNGGLR